MRQLNQDKERDRLAARLKAAIPDVMRRWEALVLAEVPAARAQERLILYNDVPEILAELAQAIAIGSVELLEDSPASKTHARQRVAVDGYSISQVLQEYRFPGG